jgi:SAM-dependent methyltransferase
MLRATQKDTEERIPLSQMDGEELGFRSETFDFVLCGFAIFFFPNPDAALREWRRVLVPGGKLVVCVVARADERWRWFEERLNVYHQQYGFPITPMSGGREINRPLEIQSHMLEAGFGESVILTEGYELVYAGEAEWWDSKWTHGSRFALENMPADLLERFHAESLADLPTLKEPDGFHERWQVAWAVGTK